MSGDRAGVGVRVAREGSDTGAGQPGIRRAGERY